MYEQVPQELKEVRAWVNVRSDSKVPMQTDVNMAASSMRPDSWGTFAEAVENVKRGVYDGIGYVFHDSGIVGIDIDAGKDDRGLCSALAIDVIGRCRSYTELSRSGRGFHILLRGKLPFRGRNNRNGLEIYRDGRYFIVTGEAMIFRDLIENQEAIDYIVETYFANSPREDNDQGSKIYEPVYLKPVDGRIRLRPYYPTIARGGRHISLVSLAGTLHNQGASSLQIYRELLRVNATACDPPLARIEVESIVKSTSKWDRE